MGRPKNNEFKHKVYLRYWDMCQFKGNNLGRYEIEPVSYVYVGRSSEDYFSDRTGKFRYAIRNNKIEVSDLYNKFIKFYMLEFEATEEEADHKFFELMQSSVFDAGDTKKATELERINILKCKSLSDNPFYRVRLLNKKLPEIKENEIIEIDLSMLELSSEVLSYQINTLKKDNKLFQVNR